MADNEMHDIQNEKYGDKQKDLEVDVKPASIGEGNVSKPFVPDENDDLIDPRLRDYPVPLVAKTVPLHNDPS
jgi:hypothetical protein